MLLLSVRFRVCVICALQHERGQAEDLNYTWSVLADLCGSDRYPTMVAINLLLKQLMTANVGGSMLL
jgi:hypothetical protein